uniref:Proteasome subunit beta n=1 Tax=Mucochytrium quahogii TaxID=96639 RepID=A0A7S2SLT0_9STRA|mmetsp:Transcript_11941/g.22003  ORF Transcript_11941/g.22003 Transcript_11941/m.22003 type:complete len:206 (-) Transcript_11941:1768-2385(-)|eukprot:CAMPEP_0203746386 /NCGR_PEP_ID=MMETSP0098-20131031/1852_1 /ASSEMBLY_ACC=CAM_ASM_000208 /TAXON_ID=96639 /ORGANISM=" , Strain NY0313808BC1" /LENGTH=205 /DNA_ID=CAMNT_0050634473 /DNA_START=188 /DNA_END=805 /DNA_ORIENTATION=+
MSIFEYNGSSVIAMTGKNCVAIASDTRFGAQALTVGTNMQRVFKMNDKTLLGLSGLATDVATVHEKLIMKLNMYKLQEHRDMRPIVFNNMLSSYLYARRFGPYFVAPIVAGLEGPENKPYISGQDCLGSSCEPNDFVVAGTAENSLFGTCESFYKPDLGPEELFETISQCLLAAVDRDCLSGWGGVVHILTPTQYIVRHLKGRHD